MKVQVIAKVKGKMTLTMLCAELPNGDCVLIGGQDGSDVEVIKRTGDLVSWQIDNAVITIMGTTELEGKDGFDAGKLEGMTISGTISTGIGDECSLEVVEVLFMNDEDVVEGIYNNVRNTFTVL